MSIKIDLMGRKFGRLTVISEAQTINGRAMWSCQCDCGKQTTVQSAHLRTGHTQSCGCFHMERCKIASTNNTWGRRCDNPQIMSAKFVWLTGYSDGCSFEKFLELSQLPCHYCGTLPSNTFNKYLTKDGRLTNAKVSMGWAERAYFKYNGLDRVDPAKGHDEDNVVPCCFPCNRAKDDRTADEFREWLIRISWHYLH